MMDCTNADVRDKLPDYASGRLPAAARESVEGHLGECADCTAELTLVRATARALAASPAVDVARIVAALPPAPRRAASGVIPIESRRTSRAAARPGWASPRRVAAIAAAVIGAVGLAVVGSDRPSPTLAPAPAVAVTTPIPDSSPVARVSPVPAPREVGVQVASASSELSLGGGVSDLSDSSLRALLGDIDNLDDSMLADPAEPLPSVTGLDEEGGV